MITVADLLHIGASLLSGVFIAGVSWGAMRASLKGLDIKLSQHMNDTATWRGEITAQVGHITQALMRSGTNRS